MVTIRLARAGTRKRAFYHIVVADKRRACNGKFIERLGFFDPLLDSQSGALQVKTDRVQHWVSKGAQLSERLQRLLKV